MGEHILFIDFCNELEKIDQTTKRLEIQSILADFLKKVIAEDPESLAAVLFLCNASIYPEYYNKELGISDFIIRSAVSEATGLQMTTLKQKLIESGDLSLIAMNNRIKPLFVPKNRLNILDVFTKLRDIAGLTGKGSVNSKKNIMKSLMSLCSPLETKYMIRLFECKLRIGLALKTILISLSLAFNEDDFEIVKDAYDKQSDFESLATKLLGNGIEKINEICTIMPGIPLKPMLAQPCKNLTKAFAKFEKEKFLSEYKYDGERVQIHHFNNQTKIFSRNCEDITMKYPDLAELKLSDKSFIIDGEVVAFKDGNILPFQILSTRRRKNTNYTVDNSMNLANYNVICKKSKNNNEDKNDEDIKDTSEDSDINNINLKAWESFDTENCSVSVFCFDILYFDDQELLQLTLEDRRKILKENFTELENKFYFTNSQEIYNIEGIDDHFKQSLIAKCEGLMLKSLKSKYKPSHRTNSWVKFKSDYLDSLGDSLDLVVIGAFYGKGKRTGTFGGFLLAVYNDESDLYEACCKIGTGFSDENLKHFYYLEHITNICK